MDPTVCPRTRTEEFLAEQYLNFPKQYPMLVRYATMRHGIRRIFLQFDFLESMHFWKVCIAGFDRYRPKNFITCDTLEKLPNLKNIHVRLPFVWWRDRLTQRGPQLFREVEPCPRTLHQFIYTRIADILAPYKHVKVDMFFDQAEEQHFYNIHQAAALALKLTKKDFDELYEDCEGGIELGLGSDSDTVTSTETSTLASDSRTKPLVSHICNGELVLYVDGIEEVFPPRCYCELPCYQTFDEIGKY